MARKNNHINIAHFSFAVPDWEVELLTYLQEYKARGGNISKLVKDSLKVTMKDDIAPRWFLRYIENMPMVQQQVEQEVKVSLDGLFERDDQ